MLTTPALLVPYGRAKGGALVAVAEASRPSVYSCPGCGSELVLRDGPSGRVRKHFAHPSHGACNQESIYHATAKRLLLRLLQENAAGVGGVITIHGDCAECGGAAERRIESGTFTGAAEEHSLGRFRPDVVGFGKEGVSLALEVLHTHAIPQEKAEALTVRWAELRASEVIAEPDRWRPVRAKLRPMRCARCQGAADRIHDACKKAGVPASFYSASRRDHTSARYIAAIVECYACHEEIPVFWWRGVPYCENTPPEPRPRTVKRRQSHTYGGAYWANTCPHCRRIQGDNFLFLALGAPLAELPLMANGKVSGPTMASILHGMLTRNFED